MFAILENMQTIVIVIDEYCLWEELLQIIQYALKHQLKILGIVYDIKQYELLQSEYPQIVYLFHQQKDYNELLQYYFYKDLNDKQRFDLGSALNQLGKENKDLKQALTYYEKMLEIDLYSYNLNKREVTYSNVIFSYDKVGETYKLLGDYQKAFDYKQQSLQLAQERYLSYENNANLKLLAKKYVACGDLLDDLGKKNQKRLYYESAIQLYQKLDDDSNHRAMAILYCEIGDSYCDEKQYDEAKYAYDLAFMLFEHLNQIDNNVKTMSDLSSIYQRYGIYYAEIKDLEQAYQYLLTHLELRQAILELEDHDEHRQSLTYAYVNLAEVLMKKQDYDFAYKHMLLAKDLREALYEKTKSNEACKSLSTIYVKVGECLERMNNYQKANTYYDKSITLLQQLNKKATFILIKKELAITYLKKCDIFIHQYDNEEALKYGKEALDLFNQLKKIENNYQVRNYIKLCNNRIYKIYYENKDYEKALKLMLEILKDDQKEYELNPIRSLYYEIYNDYYELVRLYFALYNDVSLLTTYNQAIKIINELLTSKDLNNNESNYYIYGKLSLTYQMFLFYDFQKDIENLKAYAKQTLDLIDQVIEIYPNLRRYKNYIRSRLHKINKNM